MKLLSKSRLFLLVLLALLLALPGGVLAQEPPAPAPIIKTDGVYGVDHPQNAGDVYLFKTVREIPGTLNTFHVTLHVEAKDAVNSNDIVLVIDTSGSMGDDNRLVNAQAAAVQFVNQILVPEQSQTRIALVTFASTVATRVNFPAFNENGLIDNFDDYKQNLIDTINGLRAYGGTFTQAGVKRARDLLTNSEADYKNIVLLSDGEPTYSYRINSPNEYLAEFTSGNLTGLETTTDVPDNGYNYSSSVGSGSTLRSLYGYEGWYENTNGSHFLNLTGYSPLYIHQNNQYIQVPSYYYYWNYMMFDYYPNTTYYRRQGNTYYEVNISNQTRYSNSSYDRYYNHGNSAIAEAGFAKVAGNTLHTIALSAGTSGTSVLNGMASPGNAYTTTDPTALSGIFSQIAAAISSAVSNASITDGMGVGFQLALGDASNLDPSQGEAGYNTSTSTLSWNVGSLTKPVKDLGGVFAAVDPLVKYAQLEYDVTINDNILGIPAPADGNYDVNRDATLKFTDINGAQKTSDFPVPLAKPVIVELRKEVRDNMGNLITADTLVLGRSETSDPGDRKFTFHVALRDTPTNYKDYIMNGTSSRVMADLRVDDFYTISESAITGAVQNNFADYDTSIRWQTWDNTQSSGTAIEGTTFENFKVPRDASNNPLNTTFTIVNKEKPLGVLNLTKHFDPTPGVDGDTVTAPIAGSTQEFTFHVTGPYNYVQDVKIKAGETKKLENLVYGVYTVVETAGGENFTVTYTDTYGDSANQSGTKSDGSVKLSFDNKTGGVTVLNTVKAGDVFTDFVAKKSGLTAIPMIMSPFN